MKYLVTLLILCSFGLNAQRSNLEINFGDTIINYPIQKKKIQASNKNQVAYYFKEDTSQLAVLENYYLGKLSGKYFEYYPNGSVYRLVIYQNGKANGDESIYDEFGRLTDKYQNRDGNHHGFYKNIKDNFQGRYKYGKKHGKWEFNLKTQNYYAIYFDNGDTTERSRSFTKRVKDKLSYNKIDFDTLFYDKMDTINMSSEKGSIAEKIFFLPKDSIDHPTLRKAVYLNSEKSIAKTFYIYKGSLNGVYTAYYKNGNPFYKAEYKSGILHGSYQVYYFNGSLKMQGQFKDGEKKGKWIHYNDNNQIIKIQKH